MHLLMSVVLLMSIDPSHQGRITEERTAISYLNPATNEEAKLVRQEINHAYVYRIKIDGRYVSDAYADIELFRWSPDGRHFFFIAIDDKGQKRVVYDGRPDNQTFDLIGQIQFSNKSTQLAYLGFLANFDPQKTRIVVMLDGRAINVFHEVTDLFFDKNDNLVCRGND